MTGDGPLDPTQRTFGVVVVPDGFEPSAPVGGLPPLLRHALALDAAGVEALCFVGAEPPSDRRLRARPERVDAPHARALVIPAELSSHRDVPAHLLADADLAAHGVVRIGDAGCAYYACRGAETATVVAALARGELPATDAEVPLRAGVSPEFVVRAGTADERARATTAHLRSLIKPTSGYFERWYMRPLSRPMTRALLGTSVTPNQVTVATFALGLASAWLVGLDDARLNQLGALVHLVMRVVDCVDGELARLRYQGSRLGSWLDTVGDALAMTAFVGAVGVRLEHLGSPVAPVAYAGMGAWMVVQLFQWRAAYLTDTGGTVQTIAWGHRRSDPRALEKLVAKVELLLRIDAISTYYGVLVFVGAYAPLAVAHTVVSCAAIAYYATQAKLWRRTPTT